MKLYQPHNAVILFFRNRNLFDGIEGIAGNVVFAVWGTVYESLFAEAGVRR